MANIARTWAVDMGQSLYADDGAQSYTVTSIKNDMNWNINKINERLLSKGFRMDRLHYLHANQNQFPCSEQWLIDF